jgi:Protein of unknown function (DUF3307)
VSTAAVFAALAATLYAGHQVADHVLGQTDEQAADKAKPGVRGWAANLAHVAQYHLVVGVMLAAAILVLGLDVSSWAWAAGLGFSAVTHAFLDRRWPVRWISEHTGSPKFVQPEHPLPGAYLVDQSLHIAALWVSALLMAALSG